MLIGFFENSRPEIPAARFGGTVAGETASLNFPGVKKPFQPASNIFDDSATFHKRSTARFFLEIDGPDA